MKKLLAILAVVLLFQGCLIFEGGSAYPDTDVVEPAGFEAAVGEVDLVFDTGGGDRLARSPAVLRPGGRLASVATEPPQADGIESTYFVVEPSRAQHVELARLADRGALRPRIDAVFALADAREAFERSLRRDRRGKIVLRVA